MQNRSKTHPQQKPLGRAKFTAISSVEGLKLSAAGEHRLSSSRSASQKRADIVEAYTGSKPRK